MELLFFMFKNVFLLVIRINSEALGSLANMREFLKYNPVYHEARLRDAARYRYKIHHFPQKKDTMRLGYIQYLCIFYDIHSSTYHML